MNAKRMEMLINKAYIESSSYRVKVIQSIGVDAKTPTQIGKESQIKVNHISNVLRDLKNNNLVECINEERRKGRLYCLTEKGQEILGEL